MDIKAAITMAEEALEMYETRLRFLDCYEQVVGHVAEKIKAAADAEPLSFQGWNITT